MAGFFAIKVPTDLSGGDIWTFLSGQRWPQRGIRDHNSVTLSPLDLALLDFGAYVSDAVASNAFHFVRIAIVSTRKKHHSFMKVDDFLKVAVTPATRVPLVPRRRIGD
ncbi:hypothetical protein DAPPUDRAFT_117235 [Daphnia pulex]|uniref:Uncharacterized protein n=1 Tax=Daphnia pulex TaxID=6669 RepID=E9HRZ5_DAPPU|nr:hypothetical protein DAPPUDRAFT_117235 [Daphnia pulex]|eukprot:EFX65468.1 hypothetical protein DAPPUDRAFT_117235 [Daphnia pulex]